MLDDSKRSENNESDDVVVDPSQLQGLQTELSDEAGEARVEGDANLLQSIEKERAESTVGGTSSDGAKDGTNGASGKDAVASVRSPVFGALQVGQLAEDNPIIQTAMWAFVAERGVDLEGLCLRAAQGDSLLAEEFMSDEVYKMLPRLLATWDGTRRFDHYAFNSLRQHLNKVRARLAKRRGVSLEQVLDQPGSNYDQSAELQVKELLDRLQPIDRLIIVLVKMKGYSYREAAKTVGMSYGFVAAAVNRSLTVMRRE